MTERLQLLDQEFRDLSAKFPDATLPPECFSSMKGDYVDYESRTMLCVRFPVERSYLNPMKTMQGGFIAAAFDNVLGPLSYLAAHATCMSLDLNVNYIRPILEGDALTITAKVVMRGRSTLHITAEGVNTKGKLIATCTTHMIIMKIEK